MHLSTALALASSAGLAASHPLSSLLSRAVAAFPAGSAWEIVLNNKDNIIGNINSVASESLSAIDIDLFDTPAATVSDLKATMTVICYFSAGSKEDWRPDAGDFKEGDFGQGLEGWEGEYWVNVKSENVRAIMKKRIELAAKNGCSAVDPDNVDGFGNNQDGFGYDKSAYVDYIKFLASTASANNLAIGLKNAVDLIPDVVDFVNFAINEQCHEYEGECALYKPFTDANKAVFNIEYGGDHCDSPAGVKLSTLIKPEDQGLNTLGGACAGTDAQPAPAQPEVPAPVVSTPTNSTGPIATSPPIMAPVSSSVAVPVTSRIAAPTGTPAPRPSPTSVAAKPAPTSDDPDDEDTPDDEDIPDDEDTTDDEDDEDSPDEEAEPTASAKPKPSAWKFWHRPGVNVSE